MAYLPGYSKYANLVVNGALMPGGGLAAAASGWQTVAIPAGILAACQADLRDLRITADDGVTLVDYAIESVTSGIVWVRPAAWSAGLTTVRAYGGHATAVDAQNWANVTAGWAGVWPLGDPGPTTAEDKTGNGNNGTQSGGVTFGAAGRVNGACSFDGINDLIDASLPVSLPAGVGFSVAAWIMTNSISSDSDFALDRSVDVGYSSVLQLYRYGSNMTFRIRGDNGVGLPAVTANGVLSVGAQVHVAGVRDVTSDTINIYINGSWVGSVNDTTNDQIIITPRIGNGVGDGLTYGWNGSLDNVCIAPFALSADQARLLATYPGHASQSWGAVQDVPAGGSLIHYIRRLMSGGMVRC